MTPDDDRRLTAALAAQEAQNRAHPDWKPYVPDALDAKLAPLFADMFGIVAEARPDLVSECGL